MHLAMTLLVHNDAQILEEHLIYHLNAGVDVVLAIDDGSTDGAREVLESFTPGGWVSVVPKPAGCWSEDSPAWRTLLARKAASEHHADWVLTGDPDEFWWPLTGNLKTALDWIPPSKSLVMAPCTDFVFTHEPVHDILGEFTIRERASPIAAKVAFRGSGDVVVDRGSHRAELNPKADRLSRWDTGRPMDLVSVPVLRIFHFGTRSTAQFERRVARSGRHALRREVLYRRTGREHAPGERLDSGAAWRHENLQSGLSDGSLVIDERLANFSKSVRDPRDQRFQPPAAPDCRTGEWTDLSAALGNEGIEVQELLNVAIQRRDGKLRRRARRAIEKERAAAAQSPSRRIRDALPRRSPRDG